MNGNRSQKRLTAFFCFNDDTSKFFNTPIERIVNDSTAKNRNLFSCYLRFLLCGWYAGVSSEKTEYEDIGVVNWLPMQTGRVCKVH